jgi:hypothetical protein
MTPAAAAAQGQQGLLLLLHTAAVHVGRLLHALLLCSVLGRPVQSGAACTAWDSIDSTQAHRIEKISPGGHS